MSPGHDKAALLSESQARFVKDTLRLALLDAARSSAINRFASSFIQAAAALTGSADHARVPHPALPVVGSSISRQLMVTYSDSAAAMGHPDQGVRVLGSPRLALWFEIVASALMVEPSPEITHVGVGILVHHLDRAEIGEQVTVHVSVDEVVGRRVVFSGAATVGSRLVALATHQRVLLDPQRQPLPLRADRLPNL